MRITAAGGTNKGFEACQRRLLDQLRRHGRPRDPGRQRPDGGRSTPRACLKLVREHQPATDKTADIKIEKILYSPSDTETELGEAGCRHIVKKEG